MKYLDFDKVTITEEEIKQLSQNTNVTYLSPGSKARLILDIINDKLSIQAEKLDSNIGVPLLRNASGQVLDYIGEVFGRTRKTSKKANVKKHEKNFVFYTLSPNFGAINNGEDIVIPSGSVRFFNTQSIEDESIVYINSETITLPANSDKVYFAAEANGDGEDYNVGPSTLIYHDFTGYSDSLNYTLLVDNESSIANGKAEESDENYKFEIQQSALAGEAANDTAIRLSLLSLPGVSDVVKIKFPRGIGTANWLIKAVTTDVPSSLLSMAQDVISVIQSEGSDNRAYSPVVVGVQLMILLTYRTSLEENVKNEIKTKVKKNIANYINNLAIGETLVEDQIIKVILNSDERILSMGTKQDRFKKFKIHKRSQYSDSKIVQNLIKTYSTKPYERVIVEPTLADPITIIDNN